MEQLRNSSSDSESELSISTATSSSSFDSVSSMSARAFTSSSDADTSKSLSLLSGSKSSVFKSSVSSSSVISCFFDPSTCQRQRFSIPEKIVYYMAKNCTNAKTFLKLIESCKYFFKVNPVVVISELSNDNGEWSIYNQAKPCFQFSDPQTLNFKIWVTQKFCTCFLNVSQLIPKIYKNDATYVNIRTTDQTWEELLIFAAPAENLYIANYSIKYENGEIVPFEVIVESLPNLKSLVYSSHGDGSDFNTNTFNKLMEIEHFKNIICLKLYDIPETFNIERMFNYILENKHVEINIYYRSDISDECKERINEYSNQLKNENGCKSDIVHNRILDFVADVSISSFEESIWSEDEYSDIFCDSFEDDDDEGLLFPWNIEDEEEWELPWDV